jgi:hypothetical protein
MIDGREVSEPGFSKQLSRGDLQVRAKLGRSVIETFFYFLRKRASLT